MSKRDFAKARRFANMASRGSEPITGSDLAPAIRRQSRSKAAQSTEAAKLSAGAMMTKLITCRCGHKGKVRIPVAKASGPFRCVQCGSRIGSPHG